LLYLRLFLIHPDEGGDIKVQISSEYEEFKRLWDDLISHGNKTALVHIGFTRLDNEEIIQVFRRNPGKILFTASAVSILSTLLDVKTSFVEKLFNENFYLLGEGSPRNLNIDNTLSAIAEMPNYPDWLIKGNSFNWFRNLEESRPDLTSLASQSGIRDDLSYQAYESRLPSDIRVELAYARSLFIMDVVMLSRIKDLPRILPPWTLHNSIDIFNFSVRTRKRMEIQHINKISDFALHSEEELLKIPGVGRNVINEIKKALSDYASLILASKTALLASINSEDGGVFAAVSRLSRSEVDTGLLNTRIKVDDQEQDALLPAPQSGTLLEIFNVLLSSLKDSQRTVIELRSGLTEPPRTLQEVAGIIGTTRERVRQIQKKASQQMVRQTNLGSKIKERLDDVRKGMVVPLKVNSLSNYDSWFEDCGKNPHVFEFILDMYNYEDKNKDTGYLVSGYKDLGIILKSDVDTLGQSIKDIIDFIKGNVNKGVTKTQIKEKIENVASIDAPELVDFIFYEVSEHAKFVADGNGNELLIYYGQGIESQIVEVLAKSDTPMHVAKIAEQIREKFNPMIEVESVRNNCLSCAFLFARSTYGLQKHLLFNQSEIDGISEQAKALMEALPESRQWRSNEILDELPELEQEYGVRLNQYTLAMILDLGRKLTTHGKMLFSLSGDLDEGRAKRVDFLALVESILEKSEKPLSRAEIYALVSKDRGLSPSAQIFPVGRIVSFGRGVWGLLDKHLGLTDVDFEVIVAELSNIYKKVKQGLDYEELESRLSEDTKAWQFRNTPEILFSLATKSKKFKISDIFLYPANWPEPFRTTQRIALELAFDAIPAEGITLSEILNNASLKYGHPITREAAYGAMREMGAFHDEATSRWIKK